MYRFLPDSWKCASRDAGPPAAARAASAGRLPLVLAALAASLAGCAEQSEQPTDGSPQAAAPLPGQLVVDSQHRSWLRRADEGSFFLCGAGDPEGFLYRGTRRKDGTRAGDQAELISRLASTGANGIYFIAVRSHGGDGDATQNPFVDGDPARGVSDAVLDQWAGWLETMDRAGITSYFFLYDDGTRVWDTGDEVGEAERAFVSTLVRRFRDLRHLIWVVAEEYSEALSRERASELAALIRAEDGRGHPIAVHQLSGLEFDFEGDPHVDQFAIQYNQRSAAALHRGLVELWQRADGRYNLNLSEANGAARGEELHHGTGAEARRRNWAAAMAGAYVMAIGWDIASTPVEDLEGCGRLVEFMEATPLERMSPHDELAAASTDYVLAAPGEGWVLYAADAPGGLGVRDLPAGTYDLTWLDIPSGRRVERTGVEEPGGTAVWERPAGVGPEAAVFVRPTP